MENKEFYREINNYIKTKEKEEIIIFINNIIRKIPKNKYEEVMCVINNNIKISKNEIEQKIREYKEQFQQIEEGNLTFYAQQYEDYTYGWEDWKIEYTDKDNLAELIVDVVEYGVKLVNYKEYHYAKQLFDMVLEANYQAFDEDMGEIIEISLSDLKEYDLIPLNISILCSYVIYVTYQTSNNKVQDIYNYLKNNYNFKGISIQDSFDLGIEPLTNLNDFFVQWIDFLTQTKGDTEYELLKEALIYTDFMGYEKYISKITKNQPKIYIDIFNYLKEQNKIEELINLGKKVLENIDYSSKVGSDIALYLANIDIKNKEDYLCEAFWFNTNVFNLLRIINNGYYKKHEAYIKSKILLLIEEARKNKESEDDEENEDIDELINIHDDLDDNYEKYYLLHFFIGNFDVFYNESIKYKKVLGWSYSFEKILVYLWLLLLNETNQQTKSFSQIISDVFSYIGYSEEESVFLGENVEEIWKKWKSNFKLNENIKMKVIKWLHEIIEDRVDAIMQGNYRKSYNKVALLVVAYSEMISSQNLEKKEAYIRYYIDKYPRRSAFRNELNELI